MTAAVQAIAIAATGLRPSTFVPMGSGLAGPTGDGDDRTALGPFALAAFPNPCRVAAAVRLHQPPRGPRPSPSSMTSQRLVVAR
jgi:hypothetical protein